MAAFRVTRQSFTATFLLSTGTARLGGFGSLRPYRIRFRIVVRTLGRVARVHSCDRLLCQRMSDWSRAPKSRLLLDSGSRQEVAGSPRSLQFHRYCKGPFPHISEQAIALPIRGWIGLNQSVTLLTVNDTNHLWPEFLTSSLYITAITWLITKLEQLNRAKKVKCPFRFLWRFAKVRQPLCIIHISSWVLPRMAPFVTRHMILTKYKPVLITEFTYPSSLTSRALHSIRPECLLLSISSGSTALLYVQNHTFPNRLFHTFRVRPDLDLQYLALVPSNGTEISEWWDQYI